MFDFDDLERVLSEDEARPGSLCFSVGWTGQRAECRLFLVCSFTGLHVRVCFPAKEPTLRHRGSPNHPTDHPLCHFQFTLATQHSVKVT